MFRVSLCQTLFPFLIVHMGSDVWMRPLGPVAAEGAAWMHFHNVAEVLHYLHSEAGGSLRPLKHTQVVRAAKNDATRDGYSFTFKEPAPMVVARPARPQPAATRTLASLGLTVVRCACCDANICGVTYSFTRCNAIVDEVCMARVGTEVHCSACSCRACRRALTAHLVQCRKCNFRVHGESILCTLCSPTSPSGGSATMQKPCKFNQKWLVSRPWLQYEYRVVPVQCPRCTPVCLQMVSLRNPETRGGALSAVRAQCNYLGVWPY